MRTQNISSHDCCYRCEDGLAIVGTRTDGNTEVEMYGPCPFCQKGAQKEFPEHGRAIWSREGYWRGNEHVVQAPFADGTPLSPIENSMRMQLLMRRNAKEDVDPAAGLHLPERLRLDLLMRLIKRVREAVAA